MARLFPPRSPAGGAELCSSLPAPCLGAEAALQSSKGGLSSFQPHAHEVARSEKGKPALLGCRREGVGHSLTFKMGKVSWLLLSVG